MSDDMKVAFIHSSLNIGGGEKLIASAIKSSIKRNQGVKIFANSYPKNTINEFKELSDKIFVIGDFIPHLIFGRLRVLLYYLQNIFLAIYVSLFNFDIIVSDVSSFPFLILRPICKALGRKTKFFFYCHWPLPFIEEKNPSVLRKFYLDLNFFILKKSYECADKVVVNSAYVQSVFRKSFPSLKVPHVLHPGTNIEYEIGVQNKLPKHLECLKKSLEETQVISSINRFDTFKNLNLAVKALSLLKDRWRNSKLLIAGGYNNIEPFYLIAETGLRNECYEKGLIITEFPDFDGDVIFLKNFNHDQKRFIFEISSCVLYTSLKEHFGIVPIEAMGAGVPVIAVNSCGPKETIINGKTGFLCEPTPEEFASKVSEIFQEPEWLESFVKNGKKHVEENFTEEIFQEKFQSEIMSLHQISKLQ